VDERKEDLMTDQASDVRELLDVTQRLLESIARANWDAYSGLCDPTLTAFEPESSGALVEGMGFHHFYFRLGGSESPSNATICSPHVRVLGDVGIVSYVRLVQQVGPDGKPLTRRCEETRVWHRTGGGWRHVHFHRSMG
jgi:calcium/calmodulin-dependent protein kinase (CaM kinase) II